MASVMLPALLQLSVAERIQLASELWDSVAAQPAAVPISDAQCREVRLRSEAHRRNPADALPLDEALSRLERSLG